MSEPEPTEELVDATPEGTRRYAIKRLAKRRGFQAHLFVYITVNVLLWSIWAVIGAATDGGWFPWPLFVTLGWGIGVVMHAWDVYLRRPITEADIREEIERLTRES